MKNSGFLLIVLAAVAMVGFSACSNEGDKEAAHGAQDGREEVTLAEPEPQPVQVRTAGATTSDEASQSAPADGQGNGADSGGRVFIMSPEDGATVSSPVKVVFGIEGMTLAPAGSDTPNSGHHHLLIDVDSLPPMDMPVPSDAQHVHFGKAQTETEIELEPGKHTLQLLLGDSNHIPHDPPVMSERITITVE